MLRFVDLSEDYWTDPHYGHPICAFLSTSDNRFVLNDGGEHTFSDMDDIESISSPDLRQRAKNLLPDGFFERRLDLEFPHENTSDIRKVRQ